MFDPSFDKVCLQIQELHQVSLSLSGTSTLTLLSVVEEYELATHFSGLTAEIQVHRAPGLLAKHHGDVSRVRQDLQDVPGRLVQAQVRLPQQE